MAFWLLQIPGAAALVLLGSVLGLVAFIRQETLRSRIEALERQLSAQPRSAPVEPAPAEPPAEEPAATRDLFSPVAAELPPAPEAPHPPAPPPKPSFEQRLASRWMVWLGGATLALAVVLFFNYAIEHAWLSPTVRVLLGALFGAALIAVGNLAQAAALRDLLTAAPDSGRAQNFVPASLTGAGLFALYASVEVAYALYGLLGGTVAFVALAATGFLGMTLALRHGWLVAALGMIGAYLAPALITADQPAAVTLFVYLAGVTGFALWLASARPWPLLAPAAWLGAFGWALAWMALAWTGGDELVLGPYLLAIGLVSTLVPPRLEALQRLSWWPGRASRPEDPPAGALLGMLLSCLMLLVLLQTSGHNSFAVLVLAAFVAVAWLLQDRGLVDGRLAVVAGALVVVAILTWPIDAAVADAAIDRPLSPIGLVALVANDPLLLWSAAGLSFLVWLAGLALMPRSRDPELATATAAATPLLVHVALYHRLDGFQTSFAWAAIALTVALLNLWAATRARTLRPRIGDGPLSAYAAAVTGALALAIACVLRDAWLPVALAAEVLALAWIAARLPVTGLRVLAGLLAVLTVALLVGRIDTVGGGSHAGRILHVLYGYALPLGMLWAARRLLALRPGRWDGDAADTVLAGLAVLTGSLVIHYGLKDATGAVPQPLTELTLHAVWWLVAALPLLRETEPPRPALSNTGNVLVGAGLVALVAGSVLVLNPLVTGARSAACRWRTSSASPTSFRPPSSQPPGPPGCRGSCHRCGGFCPPSPASSSSLISASRRCASSRASASTSAPSAKPRSMPSRSSGSPTRLRFSRWPSAPAAPRSGPPPSRSSPPPSSRSSSSTSPASPA